MALGGATLPQRLNCQYSKKMTVKIGILSVSHSLYSRTLAGRVGGLRVFFALLFNRVVFANCFGMIPYVFRATSHLAINLAIALPVWFAIIFMRISYNLSAFLAHLQPSGSPAVLSPFLCLIELVRLIVRPLTLSVRLTANLRTGHILIGLLGVGFINSGLGASLLILFVGVFYTMFEFAVCFIQAYIFTLLPGLYIDEHPC